MALATRLSGPCIGMPTARRTALCAPSPAMTYPASTTRSAPVVVSRSVTRTAVGVVREADHLGAQLDLGGRQRAQVGQQHRLEVVLRHAGRAGRADHRALLPGRVTDRVRGAGRGVGQRVARPQLPLDVDAAGRDLAGQPPRAEDLHRPGAHHRRPRQARQVGPPLHDERPHAPAGQGDRRGEARPAPRRPPAPASLACRSPFVGRPVFQKTACLRRDRLSTEM